MYKRLETTNQEMIYAIDELSEMVGHVYLDRCKINRQIGKLQTLVKYLPHNHIEYTGIESLDNLEILFKRRNEYGNS